MHLHGYGADDVLVGGDGADSFVYAGHFASLAATPDAIADFEQGTDHITLTDFDADGITPGLQLAGFIGTAAFGNHAGEMRFQTDGTTTQVQIDTDGTATCVIMLTGSCALTVGDFTL